MADERYSISVRLQRVRTEAAFVSVPVTEDVLRPDAENPDIERLDGEKLFAKANEIGKLETTRWEPEAEWDAQFHPVQIAPPSPVD